MRTHSKAERESLAKTLATSGWMFYEQNLYMPVHHSLTFDGTTPSPEETIWIPRDMLEVRRYANKHLDVLFETPKHLDDFYYMVAQDAPHVTEKSDSILLRTSEGLRRLGPDGKLHVPDGTFVPNTLPVPLNEDPVIKAKVMDTLVEWLGGSEEDAHSLLRHLATVLAPHWASIKYVLLLGDGRNGKSVLLEMLMRILGKQNCSHVDRLDMSLKSTVLPSMNGKLANIVMDGIAQYLKDSGIEKTLIAGETAHIRVLYSRTLTPVQTNGLFIEGLNKEPKSSDKSRALQARLVRFHFPNIYEEDAAFKRLMLSDEYTGALLALMIDHYFQPQEMAEMLAPTANQLALQFGHQYDNSHALQFIDFLQTSAPSGAQSLIGKDVAQLVADFTSWRVSIGDFNSWDPQSVRELFQPLLVLGRKTVRNPDGTFGKAPVVKGFKPDTIQYLETLHSIGRDDDGSEVLASLVED